ncbi:MAG TPA: hypothetical protein VMT71_09415 [Syntrophorhabdales bacterium]|nr:hypothetical protein [Syntrophorhabdales bacterium]
MPVPRIYTKNWERLKVAARENETREISQPRPTVPAPKRQKHRKAPRFSVILIGVLALLAFTAASLWIYSEGQLMIASRDLTDLKTRLALLQEKTKKVEDEKQRLEEENSMLSTQYEQRATELAQLEEEINALRSQKDKSRAKSKQTAGDLSSAHVAGAQGTAQEPSPTQSSTPKVQKPEHQDAKVYKLD